MEREPQWGDKVRLYPTRTLKSLLSEDALTRVYQITEILEKEARLVLAEDSGAEGFIVPIEWLVLADNERRINNLLDEATERLTKAKELYETKERKHSFKDYMLGRILDKIW